MSHRKFIKSVLWTALLVASAALAQEAAISGADFTGGKADAQLGAIGKQAAASGETVVITAPAYWQGKAAAKVRAGAHGKPVTIRFSNGFYENVLVRVEVPAPKPDAQTKSQTASKSAAKTRPQAKPESKTVKAEAAPHPVPKPVAEISSRSSVPSPHAATPVTSQPMPRRAAPPAQSAPPPSRIVAVPQVSRQPEVVPIPTSGVNPTGVQPALPATQTEANDVVRQRLLDSLNDGRPAAGQLRELQLQPGDQIYSDGGTLAVVRLEGLRRSLYWLTGPVDLQRMQYSPQGGGRYLVTGPIDPKAPATHRKETRRVIAAHVPAASDATRTRLEQQYNSGQSIAGSLRVRQLQPEDRLLVDGNVILVARREGNLMARYWLDGSLDLGQAGVLKVDQNVYQVTGSVH